MSWRLPRPEKSPQQSEELFKRIRQVRQLMGLPMLRPDPGFRSLAAKFAETGVEPLPLDDSKRIVISRLCFRERYAGETAETLLDAWLWDPTKRPVLLGPGNVGATHIAGTWVALYVGYVFAPWVVLSRSLKMMFVMDFFWRLAVPGVARRHSGICGGLRLKDIQAFVRFFRFISPFNFHST
jgi:hypothetical protein